jgi:hypothetical protein
MLGQRAVGYTQDVRGDPGRRLAESRESSVDHHQVAFRDDHSRLILQRRGHALDQIEQAFASGRDVSAVLDVVGRPEALSCDVVTLIEQGVECLEDKRLVFRFRAWTSNCRRLSNAGVKAAIKIKRRITKLGTKWIRQQTITLLVIERIVGVAVEIESVESLAVVIVERLIRLGKSGFARK